MNNLKEFRQLMEMTQEELANEIEVGLEAYQGYENGERLPNVGIAIEIAETLLCEVRDIWGTDFEEKADDYRENMKYLKELEKQGQRSIEEEEIKLWREFRENEGRNLTYREATSKGRFDLYADCFTLEELAENWEIDDEEELEELLSYEGDDILILKNGIIVQYN